MQAPVTYACEVYFCMQVSWCKFEVIVDSPKDIRVSTSSMTAVEIPPVVVAAVNLKTVINEKQNVNEIVSASVICCHKAKVSSVISVKIILSLSF